MFKKFLLAFLLATFANFLNAQDIPTVDDVNKKYENQKSNGVSIISEPTKGYHGRNLYFIHPKQVSGALIEVEERKK